MHCIDCLRCGSLQKHNICLLHSLLETFFETFLQYIEIDITCDTHELTSAVPQLLRVLDAFCSTQFNFLDSACEQCFDARLLKFALPAPINYGFSAPSMGEFHG